MTGYVIAVGQCYGCNRTFGFNPCRVPAIRDPKSGSKIPICRACIDAANPLRIAKGLDPVVPHVDAYEAIPEEDL